MNQNEKEYFKWKKKSESILMERDQNYQRPTGSKHHFVCFVYDCTYNCASHKRP